jgi:hypothetical protein
MTMFGLDSETLSTLAILISIFGTLFSLFYTYQSNSYTKKEFEAAFHPHLFLQVLERSGGKSGLKTCLSFKFTNQSPDRTAANVRLRAFLSHPTGHWRLWSIKWYKFFEKSGFNLAPEEVKETHPASRGYHADDIEQFLLKTFPKVVYPEDNPETPEEVAFTKPVIFLLHVQVTFQAPISGAKELKQNFYYRLIPQFRRNNGNRYCLNFWTLESIKAS